MASAAAEQGRKLKVAFFGTHPKQYNGYSRVVYCLAKAVAQRYGAGVKMHVFGFQNFYNNPAHRDDLPPDVDVYDAWADETPKQAGFGVSLVKNYVATVRPDVCVVFNDLMVLSSVVNELKDAPTRAEFKILAYIDQVYLCQKRDFIGFLNAHVDAAIAFTPEWRECIVSQGLTLPCHVLPHGLDPATFYPVPRALARRFYGLSPDDFLILNLNRNQPRKRWDTCIKAFAEVVARLPDAPIKLVIGTEVRGKIAAWDLIELYERELAKRGVPLQKGLERLVIPGSPQQLSDSDTNILYNIADIGINTCDGEGFGLCQFEQAACGVPQVVPRLGGFLHFFDDTCAAMVDPKVAVYVDATRDGVGGEALLSDYADFADAIVAYYNDAELRARHGQAARRRILEQFSWERIADDFVGIVTEVAGKQQQQLTQLQRLPSVAGAGAGAAPQAADQRDAVPLGEALDAILGTQRQAPSLSASAAPAAPAASPAVDQALSGLQVDELKALRARLDALLGSTAHSVQAP